MEAHGRCSLRIHSLSFSVKLRVAVASMATGAGTDSGCPSGKLIKYSSTVWSRTSSGCSSVANLFPVRPGVTLLFVFLSSEGFHAKALRALVADGDFRRLAAHIANVVCVFGLGVGSQGNYLHDHSPLPSTQKLDRPTAMSLWVRWSNTTYSPGDSVVSSLMRMFADARSLTGSNLRKLPARSFFRISNGECMDASRFAWCCKAN